MKQLDRLEQDVAEIKAMLSKLLNPVETMDARVKADAIHKALMSGDRKHYRDVLKEINGD